MTLYEQNNTIYLARQSCVDQLSAQNEAWLRDHNENSAKLAPLALVHGERVSEFKNHRTVVAEVARPIDERVAGLRTELNVKAFRCLAIPCFAEFRLTDDDSYLAI
ncbi:hypothetical protein ACNKFW_07515 [Paracoccus sp. TD-10]|uniref:hypothetical protein n=1 Tax=Paracoccus sp. TD-10 TaxID=3395918 RepID=UPI003AAB9B06